MHFFDPVIRTEYSLNGEIRPRAKIKKGKHIGKDGMSYIVEFEGTLTDADGCFEKVFSEAFAQFSIPFERERLKDYVSLPLDKLFSKYYTGCTCRFRDFMPMYIGLFDSHFGLINPMEENLSRVRELIRSGANVSVISGCYEMYVRRFLEEHGLSVQSVVSTDRTNGGIPDGTMLSMCLSDLHSEPGETVLISSDPRLNGIASKMGIRTD
jgi:phosphoglycolate phosphatase-like HAD superfamily hydrolase